MAVQPVGPEIKSQELNDNFSDVEDNIESHKAERVSQVIATTRDLSITGIQTITTETGRRVKGVVVNAVVNGTKKSSYGMYSAVGGGVCIYVDGTSGNSHNGVVPIILSQDSATNRTRALITINEGSIDLDWAVLSGTGAIGTANVYLMVTYHD